MENKVAYYELDDRRILFLAQSHSTIPLTGKLTIQLLKGSAEILGYNLPLNKKLICESSKDRPSLVLNAIHHLPQKLVSNKYIKRLFEKLNIAAEVPFAVSLVFMVRYSTPEAKKLEGPSFSYFESWRTHISEITSISEGNQRIMVTGAKNMGKSVFLLHLINSYLSQEREVYCIDTDLGKPLFTLEGTVTLSKLVAPILTNKPKSQKVLRSFMINDTTPKDKPMLYLRSIAALHSFFQGFANKEDILVINTHGWTDGLGFTLLEEITEIVKPTVIVSLETGFFMERSEYETALHSGTLKGANASTKVIHIEQKDIKLYLQAAGKYKVKNIEEVYNLTSSAGIFVPFDNLEFLLPRAAAQVLDGLTKYELLSIFNSQYVALVKLGTTQGKIENLLTTLWSEEELLEIYGVAFISNIDYDKGLYVSSKVFTEPESALQKYQIIPLSESIHPRWLADDPVNYIGCPYYYDTYSELSYMPNKRQLTK